MSAHVHRAHVAKKTDPLRALCGYAMGRAAPGAPTCMQCARLANPRPGKNTRPGYKSWQMMLNRCRNPRSQQWRWYGGRGITVCERWYDFDAFVAESGMNEVKWYEIAKSTNTSVSVFDLDKTLDNFCKKLEKNDLPGLAAALRKAEQDYFASAIRGEMQVAA